MKIFISFLYCIFFSTIVAFGQIDNANLLVQSPDGKTVKLVWFLKSVPDDVNGFDIKRKDGLGDWKQLNTDPLLPGISLKKDLSPYESDNVEVSRIKEKLKTLIAGHQLTEYDYPSFMSRWRNGDREIQDIVMLASTDFDVSVICGFGFVDHTVSQKTSYQYGLFIQGTDKLIAKAVWNYGEVPNLDEIKEVTSRAHPGKPGVTLLWSADMERLKKNYVAGFNVYRRGIRLNDAPVKPINGGLSSEFMWNDRAANSSAPEQYSISAQTIFGIEGIIRPYTYLPEEHPTEYVKSKITEINSLGFYFKDGINVEWTFPRDQERFIKGFLIEKNNIPDGYKVVSELLAPGVRKYIDKTGSPVSSHITMRVTAFYNDKTKMPGRERVYSYFPLTEPPAPQHTIIKGKVANDGFSINISWDSVMMGDGATNSYQIYQCTPSSDRFNELVNDLPKEATSYRFSLKPGIGGTYKFYCVGKSKSGSVGIPGDTISVSVPSLKLPKPDISNVKQVDSSIVISWQYPEVPDLAGFRLYNGNTLIADESEVKSHMRTFETKPLKQDQIVSLTLKATTVGGVLSGPSEPELYTVTLVKKKGK